jgi:hypothetical protein
MQRFLTVAPERSQQPADGEALAARRTESQPSLC